MIDARFGGDTMTRDGLIDLICENGGCDHSDAPESVQAEFQEWLRDDHYPLSPVNKDDFDELWDKFCEQIAKHVQPGFVIGDGSKYGRIAEVA